MIGRSGETAHDPCHFKPPPFSREQANRDNLGGKTEVELGA
jgi:hypothetical protein